MPARYVGYWYRGTAEKAAVLAKESLMDPIDIHELGSAPASRIEELRLEIMDRANALGIGAQGLGGLTTVLDVKIRITRPMRRLYRWHDPKLRGTRHVHFTLDGSGPAALVPPKLDEWPEIH